MEFPRFSYAHLINSACVSGSWTLLWSVFGAPLVAMSRMLVGVFLPRIRMLLGCRFSSCCSCSEPTKPGSNTPGCPPFSRSYLFDGDVPGSRKTLDTLDCDSQRRCSSPSRVCRRNRKASVSSDSSSCPVHLKVHTASCF